MPSPIQCPQCGAAQPEGLLQGLCPRCLARQATGILSARSGGTVAAEPARLRYFGDYELLEEIARGGMGVVWKARQVSLHRIVAVKVLLAGRFSSPEFVQRFRAEAEAAANLQHPSIVAIHEVGEHEGQPYFSMDFVEGPDLAQLAREQPLPPRRAAGLVQTIAEAVHYAHQRGVIHRDLKPSNVLLDAQGEPRVTDFGLAKRLPNAELETRNEELTLTGQVLGTPGYMPPEQTSGRRGAVTVASDVYGLGAVLYFLLTGRAPFAAESVEEVLEQVRHHEPCPPALLNPSVPRDLETICAKCLSKEPGRRYASAQALADDLDRFRRDEPIHARPVSRLEHVWRWCRRRPMVAGLFLALFAVLGLGLGGIFWQWAEARKERRVAERNKARAEANLYVSDMNRAQQALDEGALGAASALLERHWDKTNLHDFEFRLLWKRVQGDCAATLPQPGAVWKLHFSADAEYLAVVLPSNRVDILHVPTRQVQRVLTNVASTAGFAPGTHDLILAFRDATNSLVAACHVDSGVVTPHFHTRRSLYGLSGQGRQLLASSGSGPFLLLGYPSGEVMPFGRLPPQPGSIRFVGAEFLTFAVSKDLRYAVMPDDLKNENDQVTLSVYDLLTNSVVTQYVERFTNSSPVTTGDRQYLFRLLQTGPTVLWTTFDGFIRKWRWTEETQPTHVAGHQGTVYDIAVAPDETWFATASADQTIRLWDVSSLRPLGVLRGHTAAVSCLALSPDGQWLASGGRDRSVKLWRMTGLGGQNATIGTLRRATSNRLCFSPRGDSLALGVEPSTVQIIDTTSLRELQSFAKCSLPISYSRDGSRLFAMRKVVNLVTGEVESEYDAPGRGYTWAYEVAPDQSSAIVARDDRQLRVWDLASGREVSSTPLRSSATACVFLPNSTTLAVGDAAGRLHWLQFTNRTLIQQRETQVFPMMVYSVACSSDGRTLALGGSGQICLVDAASGAIRERLPGHRQSVSSLAFAPGGGTLASASSDGTIKLWSLKALQDICTITFDEQRPLGVEPGVACVRFCPDGNSLWAFSRSGALKVWRAARPEEVATAGIVP